MDRCMRYGWMDGWMDVWMDDLGVWMYIMGVCGCVWMYIWVYGCMHPIQISISKENGESVGRAYYSYYTDQSI